MIEDRIRGSKWKSGDWAPGRVKGPSEPKVGGSGTGPRGGCKPGLGAGVDLALALVWGLRGGWGGGWARRQA